MLPFVEGFVCCGGRRFVYVPFVGLLEQSFAAAALGVLGVLAALVALARRFPRASAATLALAAAAGQRVFREAVARSETEGGVKGWLEALDMARVDEGSDAFTQWVRDQTQLLDGPGVAMVQRIQPDFKLLAFEHPWRGTVLSQAEAAEASAALLADKDGWIHMDKRVGPLPGFIYGTYYQYNSHGRPFPTPAEAGAARVTHEARGDESPAFEGHRATSTINYLDRHGVHAYNARQRRVLGKLDVHERLRLSLVNATGGMEVVYHPNWGLPGAQITFSHRVMEFNVFQAHIDGSWAPITQEFAGGGGANGGGCVPSHRLSVTLTLQKPSTGGGLDLWVFDRSRANCTDAVIRDAAKALRRGDDRRQRERHQDAQRAAGAAADDHARLPSKEAPAGTAEMAPLTAALECLAKVREEYAAGEVVVHSGSVIHAVAPWAFAGPAYDEARITIQGFAFLCAGKWHLHW